MITELAARGTMRYWARDKVTHEIKQADGTSAADGVLFTSMRGRPP